MSSDIMYNLICALLGVNVAVVSYYLRRHDRQHDMISKAVDELKNQRVLCVSLYAKKEAVARLHTRLDELVAANGTLAQRVGVLEASLEVCREER